MKKYTVSLKSISPYSQSKFHDTPKLDREQPGDYETRTWRERLHVNEDGYVIITPMTFKNCLSNAAQFLSERIPGKQRMTYTKHFKSGILVVDHLVLSVKKDDVKGEWLFLPSDGKAGGGSRVKKCYPILPSWSGNVEFLVLDEIITKDVFVRTLEKAGQFIGIGRFRPQNNGFYGRFSIESVKVSD